ncbi:MAG: hypothetical protein IJV98_07385 [Clostridia bacterium]|nr:hypothetical protein [Clostridia bacterium]
MKITLDTVRMPAYAIALKNGRITLEIQAFDGEISVSVQYDCDRRPLTLSAPIENADQAEIVLMAHRIELYVNGELRDEEWPMGMCLFSLGDSFITNASLRCDSYREPPKHEDAILGYIENAEGWHPDGDVFVGDCMPYRRDDEYHVLYLKDRHHHKSKWGLGAHQWEHISTEDFKTWRIHPMAIPITDASEGSICTGSWIRHGGREYLYYTVRRAKGLPARICRSVSDDGYHFVKDEHFGFTVSEAYDMGSARDPKVIKGEDGLFHMFLTTGFMAERKGCLAHYVSRDMETWDETERPIYISTTKDQPECPDYIVYQGHYYLIFSLRGQARYLISDAPLGPWREPRDPIIPCASVPKGALWGDRIVFAGFRSLGGYGGSMTFKAARASENGELIFETL